MALKKLICLILALTMVVFLSACKRMNMFSILVKQVGEKDIFITKLKRPIENAIIKKSA